MLSSTFNSKLLQTFGTSWYQYKMQNEFSIAYLPTKKQQYICIVNINWVRRHNQCV